MPAADGAQAVPEVTAAELGETLNAYEAARARVEALQAELRTAQANSYALGRRLAEVVGQGELFFDGMILAPAKDPERAVTIRRIRVVK